MEQRIFGFLRQTSTKVVLLVIQIVLLVLLALSHYATTWYGQDIQLKTVPIDPRDLMYGDYVTLQYDINTLPYSLWKDRESDEEFDKIVGNGMIYVVLAPGGANGTYLAEAFYTHSKPDATENQIILRAKTLYVMPDIDQEKSGSIRVKYGLETYYVQENTGKDLEEQARKGELIATVKVSKWSSPVLTSLDLAQ